MSDEIRAKFRVDRGDFVLDVDPATNETHLITSEGRRLQGVMGSTDLTGLGVADLQDIVLPANTTSYSVGLDGILYVSVDGGTPAAAGRIASNSMTKLRTASAASSHSTRSSCSSAPGAGVCEP